MNYRHIYHAGNFADVFKHTVLTLLLNALCRKPAPFCYLDTHGGVGRYDLKDLRARRSGEAALGIARLWPERAAFPELSEYFVAIAALNTGTTLRTYPGSPSIARHLMRPQDRALLLELHPEDAAALKSECASDVRVHVHARDAYEGLLALVPPAERRGLVLIDPPYEQPDEFTRLGAAWLQAAQRWPTGCYALWYPLKDTVTVGKFLRRMEQSGQRKLLNVEFWLHTQPPMGVLAGCGMVIQNPPYGVEAALRKLLPRLLKVLQPEGTGATRVTWVVPE